MSLEELNLTLTTAMNWAETAMLEKIILLSDVLLCWHWAQILSIPTAAAAAKESKVSKNVYGEMPNPD